LTYVVVSSDGTKFGPFDLLTEAVTWAEKNDEELGDWFAEDLYAPEPE
jgi:hypothetical protein